MNRAFNCSSRLASENSSRGSAAAFRAERKYDNRMSQMACWTSLSLRTRNVIHPELGTQRCPSASPSARRASRTERGNGISTMPPSCPCRPLHCRNGILCRQSGAREPISRPRGNFLFQPLQMFHNSYRPLRCPCSMPEYGHTIQLLHRRRRTQATVHTCSGVRFLKRSDSRQM